MCSRKMPEQGAKTVKTELLGGVLGTFRRPFQLQKASFYVAKGLFYIARNGQRQHERLFLTRRDTVYSLTVSCFMYFR